MKIQSEVIEGKNSSVLSKSPCFDCDVLKVVNWSAWQDVKEPQFTAVDQTIEETNHIRMTTTAWNDRKYFPKSTLRLLFGPLLCSRSVLGSLIRDAIKGHPSDDLFTSSIPIPSSVCPLLPAYRVCNGAKAGWQVGCQFITEPHRDKHTSFHTYVQTHYQ